MERLAAAVEKLAAAVERLAAAMEAVKRMAEAVEILVVELVVVAERSKETASSPSSGLSD